MFILAGGLRIHLTRLSTEGLGPRHGEVRRAHQMLNAALLKYMRFDDKGTRGEQQQSDKLAAFRQCS